MAPPLGETTMLSLILESPVQIEVDTLKYHRMRLISLISALYRKALITVILSCSFIATAYGHQDRYYKFKEENVLVRIRTGYEYEEVQKAEMLARMISDLAKSVTYTDNILIDFIHDYTYNRNTSDFFVSYKKSRIIQNYEDTYLSKNMNNANLIIRNLNTEVNFEEILRLVEASIQNENFIKRNQDRQEYKGGYNRWILHSLPQSQIDQMLNLSTYTSTRDVLNNRYYRKGNDTITYYYQNGLFNFVYGERRDQNVFLQAEKLFQLEEAGDIIIVAETPCNIYIRHNTEVIKIDSLKYCEGIWRKMNILTCSDNAMILNYRTGVSDTYSHSTEGINVELNFGHSSTKIVESFNCKE